MDRDDLIPSPPRRGYPLVSIVSPVYNQERHVARCVESALAQTYPHWEQLIVDDGSTDGTRDIVASYGDPRIRVLALPHRGLRALGESYNAALAASHGSLVGILEGDDRWPADKLARQVPLFEEPTTLLTWGRAQLVDDADVLVGHRSTMSGRSPTTSLPASAAFLRLTRLNFLVPSVTVMVRRTALDAAGGFQQSASGLFVDLATWLRITALCEGQVVFRNAVLGVYRLHEWQVSQRRRAQMAREHWRVVQHVASSVGADALARVGWDAHARRHALSRGLLTEGEMALLDDDRGAALSTFRAAFTLGGSAGDRMLALLGMASAASRVNLVSLAFALRQRLSEQW